MSMAVGEFGLNKRPFWLVVELEPTLMLETQPQCAGDACLRRVTVSASPCIVLVEGIQTLSCDRVMRTDFTYLSEIPRGHVSKINMVPLQL